MSWRNILAIVRHELRIMAKEPSTLIFVVGMPLLLTTFMRKLFQASLAAEGFTEASGAEQAVPGMAVAFAAFGVGFSGFAFFREHGWGTWERLRASPASSMDIMTGKVIPSVMLTCVQLGLLFGLGPWLFDLHIGGSVFALVLVCAGTAFALNAFGVAITAVSTTQQQLNAFGSLGGMVMATLGGAFVPLSALPGWAQDVAPAIPTYWSMTGLRAIILEGAGLADVALNVLVLAAFAAGFAVLTATRFRFEETKIYFG